MRFSFSKDYLLRNYLSITVRETALLVTRLYISTMFQFRRHDSESIEEIENVKAKTQSWSRHQFVKNVEERWQLILEIYT